MRDRISRLRDIIDDPAAAGRIVEKAKADREAKRQAIRDSMHPEDLAFVDELREVFGDGVKLISLEPIGGSNEQST